MTSTKRFFLAFFLLFFGVLSNRMEKIVSVLESSEKENTIAEALRRWQKQSVAKRPPLAAFARKHGTTAKKMISIMRKGPRRRVRVAGAKIALSQSVIQECETPVKKRFPSRITKTKSVLSSRTVRRIVQPAKEERRLEWKNKWAKWHRENANEELSEEQSQSLSRVSRHW